MKTKLLLAFLLFHFTSMAQGRKNLDLAFGIGKFKLESSYSNLQKDLKYYFTDKKGVEFYDYIGKELKSWLGYPILKIQLAYYENKLYTISLNFGTLNSNQDNKLVDKLSSIYDLPDWQKPNSNSPEGGRIWIAQWETGKVYMLIGEYSCNSTYMPCETDLFILSKKIQKQIKSE